VVGDGPLDLVFVMGWVSHLEYFWQEPSFARFLRRLASFSRLILFDKRGTGLSDRVTALPTLEERMDDVRAVMEAVGSERAALLGISEGGPMCSLFAATYPEKTSALVMIGTYAKRDLGSGLPVGADARNTRVVLRRDPRALGRPGRPRGACAERRRGSGVPRVVEHLPAHGRQPRGGAATDADERRDRRPLGAAADPRADADSAPHRRSLPSRRRGRFMAGKIPDARFVELPARITCRLSAIRTRCSTRSSSSSPARAAASSSIACSRR
jgi:pimeloyl-ACP methyl ester carboxylesterase